MSSSLSSGRSDSSYFSSAAESLKEASPAISDDDAVTATGQSAGERQGPALENAGASCAAGGAARQDTKPRPGKERKGDASLLAGKRAVNFRTAEQYLGLTERQRQNLVKDQVLVVEGKGQNKKDHVRFPQSLPAARKPNLTRTHPKQTEAPRNFIFV